MKLLILGGTLFLGRHLVEVGRERGDEITTFTRGIHNPAFPGDIEQLHGDRDGDLHALENRSWDVVIDTSGYIPRVVGDSARLLAGAADLYVFISTLSVYPDVSKPGIAEDAPVGRLDDSTVEEVTGETYGPLKALCEAAAEAAFPGRALTIRPGLIVGKYDPTDRFTYWPHRIAQGGEVLAPDGPGRRTQFIDARDLASWTLTMAGKGATGVYNATGPDYPLTMGAVLEVSNAMSGSDARVTWVPGAFLLESGVAPWSDMPLWVPEEGEYAGFNEFDIGRACEHGLTFRPLRDTIADTLTWDSYRESDYELKAGISRERERQLLEAWHLRAKRL